MEEALMPREKATRYGIASLSDAELVALLLETGNRKMDVLTLSKQLLFQRGGLRGLLRCEEKELYGPGIKKAKSYRLLAVKEILRRLPLLEDVKFSSLEDVVDKTRFYFLGQKTEVALVLFLSRDKTLLSLKCYESNLEGAVCLPFDEIIRETRYQGCRYVLLLHNHPSGNLSPSDSDIFLMKRLNKLLLQESLILLDSLIVCEEKFYSMRQKSHLC